MTTDRAGGTFGASLSPMPAAHPLAFELPSRSEPVVQPRHQVAANKAGCEPVTEANQATDERHPVAAKELAEQRQMRADRVTALDDEPVRRNEDYAPQHNPAHDTLHPRVKAGEAGQDDVRLAVLQIAHRT